MPRFQDQILDEYMRPVPGADIWVFYASGPSLGQQAALTDDAAQPLAQPLASDADGIFYYNAADGLYENHVHYGGELRYVQQALVGAAVGTALDGDRGDITISGAGTDYQIDAGTVGTVELADNAVTLPKLADVASGSVFYRKTAGAGDPETQPIATLKTDLGLAGNNSGDQVITLTGDVTGSGTGSFATTIAAGAVTAPKLANGAIETKLGFTPASDAIFTSGAAGLAPASGGGAVNFLRADGTWAAPAGGGVVVTSFNTRTGAVTLTAADVTDALTYTPASDALVSTSAAGLCPTRPGGTTAFLRGDGTWAIPAGGGGGAGVWGAITGTLSDQTDLQTALNGKAALVHTHVIADVTGLQAALDGKADDADLTAYMPKTGGTFSADINVPDEAYGGAWDGSLEVPTKNAVYDKIQALGGGTTTNPLTINNGGAGAASGATFNGAAAVTISHNSIGAAPLTPREQAVASAASVTPTFLNDIVIITALAVGLTLANWTGTAIPNHGMAIRIKAAGVQTIGYGANYRAIGVVLPTATVAGKTLYLGCIWNATDGKIDVVSVALEA